MPAAAMYGWLGELANMLGAPSGWAYCSCLTLFAGQGVQVVDQGFSPRPTLYTCLIGPPGSGKSYVTTRAHTLLKLDPAHVRTATPASDRGLVNLLNGSRENSKSLPDSAQDIVLIQDELRDTFAKINIHGSSLAPLFCKLFYADEGGSADKTGLHEVRVRLSMLGGLAVKDTTEFQAIFGSGTTAGLHDRFLYAPGPPNWMWDLYWRPPMVAARRPCLTEFRRAQQERLVQWGEDRKQQGFNIGRVTELAMRVAVISASANGDSVVTDECVTAAIHFAEWQRKVRAKYGPGDALNMDAQVSAAILDAFIDEASKSGELRFIKWRDLANNKNFNRKFGSPNITKNRDSLLAAGQLEAQLGENKKLTGFYRLVPETQTQAGW